MLEVRTLRELMVTVPFHGRVDEPRQRSEDRKAVKPDLESMTHLPPSSAHPFGTLLAIGSVSRPNRQHAVLLHLDELGRPQGCVWSTQGVRKGDTSA